MERVQNKQSVETRDMLAMAGMIVLVIISAFVLILFYGGSESNLATRERTETFLDGWTVQAGDMNEEVTLPFAVNITGDEEIVLTRKLPKQVPSYSAIVTRNYHMTMTVSINGEEIFKYPNGKRRMSTNVIADDWNLVEIPVTAAGKTLTITLKPDKLGFKGMIRPIYFGEDNAILQYLRKTYRLHFGMGVSIIIAGLLMFAVNVVYRRFFKDSRQAIIGLMLMITGIWLTNRSKMPLRALGSSLVFYVCFACLLMVPTAIMIYYRLRFQGRNDKLTLAIMRLCFVVGVGVIVMSYVSSYSVERFVPAAYAMVGLTMAYTEITLYRRSFGKESRGKSADELFDDRFEFTFTLLMFMGFIFETVTYTDELWTEVNIWNRIAFNIYAYGHVIATLITGYKGIKERDAIEEKLHDSQMELLMGQIQPHYIFNTLSSIRTLTKLDPDKAYDMIYDFSKYLRANVDNMGKIEGINFSEEVEHIKSYVNIEQVRYDDKLNVEYDIRSSEFKVPALSIQPLVENAIKHGVGIKPEGGHIWIRSFPEGEYNVVQIEDDGVGFTLEGFRKAFCGAFEEKASGLSESDIHREMAREIISSSVIKDENGEVMDLVACMNEYQKNPNTEAVTTTHKSTGMRNILIRLKEISNAKVEIESQKDKGTIITVKFPL